MHVEPVATETVKTGLTVASCIGHIKNNRIEYLIVSLLMYSIGALDKAIEYGTGICVCMWLPSEEVGLSRSDCCSG